ncbi:hypothetical protein BaRGS_00036826 [Batillaria attramentaria]|uniref:Uncharacterized protein n=1 Tax=Batillaria attramentaria TaxID=370345 RepID=A0ABD0JAP3_9CAEN
MDVNYEQLTNVRLRFMSACYEELEEQRRLSREAAKEKLVAVAQAKEQVREQSSVEVEQAKEKVKQELQRELDRLQTQLRDAEEEVRTLKAGKHQLLSRERDNLSALDRTEKTVINEINEECRRSASLLGVSPRQVQFSTVSDSSSRSQITAALANLRAVNEELRNHIQELSSELDSCRAMINTMEKEKEESLENIRLEMEKKRTLELEKLKEKLIRLEVDALDLSRTEAQFPQYRPSPNASFRLDLSESRDSEDMANEHTEELAKVAQASARQSLANSMVGALRRKDTEIEELKAALDSRRDQAAEKYASLYKTEMSKELEKSQALLLHTSREQKRINDAQQREIDRLEREVQRLAMPRRPASPTRDHKEKLRNLEERIRLGEKEALMAEERAKLNSSAMSQKMAEMTKLQNTLSNQNEELHRLEQAYTQLHRQYNQSPVIAVSHVLNTTF